MRPWSCLSRARQGAAATWRASHTDHGDASNLGVATGETRSQHHQRRGSCALLPLLLGALVAGVGATTAAPPPSLGEDVVSVNTGQELADAVAQFGRTGRSTTVQLQQDFMSLANATFTRLGETEGPGGAAPFSRGTLTLQARPGAAKPALVDAAMQGGLTSPFSGTAKLVLNRVSFVNLCESHVQLGPGVSYNTGLGLWLFNRSSVLSNMASNAVTLYGRQASVGASIWFKLMQDALFPQLYEQTLAVHGSSPKSLAAVRTITPHAVLIARTRAGGEGVNVTLKSTADVFDPVLSSVALMEPRFCNGTLLPAATRTAQVDPMAPLYLVTDSLAWVEALSTATATIAAPKQPDVFRGLPIILLSGTVQLRSLFTLPRISPLVGWLLLAGPSWDEPDFKPPEALLDLGGTAQLLEMESGSDLFIQNMVITGLGQSRVPTKVPNPAAPDSDTLPGGCFSCASVSPVTSVLPFTAFRAPFYPDPIASPAFVWMANVTLRLPGDDYLALVLLALNGTDRSIYDCASAQVKAKAAVLQHGVRSLKVWDSSLTLSYLRLSRFVGWAINASSLLLQPEDPLAPYRALHGCVSQAEIDRQISGALDVMGNSPPDLKATLIMGSVLGTLLVVMSAMAGLAVLALAQRMRKDRQRDLEQAKLASKQCGPHSPGSAATPSAGAMPNPEGFGTLSSRHVKPSTPTGLAAPLVSATAAACAAAQLSRAGPARMSLAGSGSQLWVHPHSCTSCFLSSNPLGLTQPLQQAERNVRGQNDSASWRDASRLQQGTGITTGTTEVSTDASMQQSHGVKEIQDHETGPGLVPVLAQPRLLQSGDTGPNPLNATAVGSAAVGTGLRAGAAATGVLSGVTHPSALGAGQREPLPCGQALRPRQGAMAGPSTGQALAPQLDTSGDTPPPLPPLSLVAPTAWPPQHQPPGPQHGQPTHLPPQQQQALQLMHSLSLTFVAGVVQTAAAAWQLGAVSDGAGGGPGSITTAPKHQLPEDMPSQNSGGGVCSVHSVQAGIARRLAPLQSVPHARDGRCSGGAVAVVSRTTAPLQSVPHDAPPLLPPQQQQYPGEPRQQSSSDPRRAVQELVGSIVTDSNKVTLHGVLGKGSWGTVWRGEWRGLPVALKTLIFEAERSEVQRALQQQQQHAQHAGGPAGPAGVAHEAGAFAAPEEEAAGGRAKGAAGVAAVQKHHQAIMEAAIAASVGHRNLVCTYHYDIKPLSDSLPLSGCSAAQDITHPAAGVVALSSSAAELLPRGAGQELLPRGAGQEQQVAYKLYLVQELCESCLSVALRQHMLHNPHTGLVEVEVVLGLLLDIASGLQYMHERNIIHGDLKPGNVLLKTDLSPSCRMGVVAKLADFGLSARIAGSATHVSNFSCGTPFYVAPEVIHEFRTSTASDMYSFGVLMWQMWTGRAPYVVTRDGAYAQSSDFPTFNPDQGLLPTPVYEDLLARCLQREPRARPSARTAIIVLEAMLLSLQPRPA